MAHPNADDPIDTARAEEYHVDKAEYNRKAAEHTKKHASRYAQTCTLHSHVRSCHLYCRTMAEFLKDFGVDED
jgi:hypothetical protein